MRLTPLEVMVLGSGVVNVLLSPVIKKSKYVITSS